MQHNELVRRRLEGALRAEEAGRGGVEMFMRARRARLLHEGLH